MDVECLATVPGREVRPKGDASFGSLPRNIISIVDPNKAKQEMALPSE